jgi:putative transposase
MTEHLGYERHDPKVRGTPNSRNGIGAKTLKTDHGPMEIEVPGTARAAWSRNW